MRIRVPSNRSLNTLLKMVLAVLIPFRDRCVDDRSATENLSVVFTIADELLLNATMVQDDIRVVLMPRDSMVLLL